MNRTLSAVIVASCAVFSFSTGSEAAELFVPGDSSTIQGAIGLATSGDTITVAPGTYNEVINYGSKNLRIRSTGGASVTTINGSGLNNSVVTVAGNQNSDFTTLEGFRITGGSGKPGGARGATGPGGGIYLSFASASVRLCIIDGNTATNGAGVFASSSNVRLVQCLIRDNVATSNGGGLYTVFGSPQLLNSTVANNIASAGGGVYVLNELSGISINNSIIWGNSGGSLTTVGGPAIFAQYSNVQGVALAGPGNIDQNPMFVSASNFQLQASSPSIDAANSQLIDTYSEDLSGDVRGVNHAATPFTGIPSLGIYADMGPYEFQVACDAGPSCPGDVNGDNIVNVLDLLEVISNWGSNCP